MSRIERIRQMIEKSPGDADLRYMLAQEHAKAGDHAAAIAAYDACLAADAGYLYAYFHKAASQQSLADLPGARATLEAGVQRARTARDQKALSELSAFLASLND